MKQHEQAAIAQRLKDMRARLIRYVDLSEQALREDVHHPGELSNVPTHPADHDVDGLDREIAIAQNEEQLLSDVEAALVRIADGTFGNCENCQQPIPAERLAAIPYARWCIACAGKLESEREES